MVAAKRIKTTRIQNGERKGRAIFGGTSHKSHAVNIEFDQEENCGSRDCHLQGGTWRKSDDLDGRERRERRGGAVEIAISTG